MPFTNYFDKINVVLLSIILRNRQNGEAVEGERALEAAGGLQPEGRRGSRVRRADAARQAAGAQVGGDTAHDRSQPQKSGCLVVILFIER